MMMRVLATIALLTIAAPAVADETSPAWIEAKANQSAMKTEPKLVSEPNATLPESEKALGHHGPVIITGILGIDGKLKDASVKTSSKAPVLDDIALTAANAATFAPAKDANGTAIPVVISIPFGLVDYKAEGGGLLQYKCAQFVRDMDWWSSVNPEKSVKDHELYRIEFGAHSLSVIQRLGGNVAQLSKELKAFEARWTAAIELCRKKPDMLQRAAVFR